MDSETPRRNVIYLPPSPAVVTEYARELCRRLGDEFTQPEVMGDVVSFIKLVVAFKTREMNEGAAFDNESR